MLAFRVRIEVIVSLILLRGRCFEGVLGSHAKCVVAALRTCHKSSGPCCPMLFGTVSRASSTYEGNLSKGLFWACVFGALLVLLLLLLLFSGQGGCRMDARRPVPVTVVVLIIARIPKRPIGATSLRAGVSEVVINDLSQGLYSSAKQYNFSDRLINNWLCFFFS